MSKGKETPGPIWIIGDVQGCGDAMDTLLAHPDLSSDPDARFWFAGDLVNRGPDSLYVLKRILDLGERVITVLGNHDLHLLAVAAGVRKAGPSDTFQDVLDAPEANDLIDWLRRRPLAHYEFGHLLVHAGVPPQWSLKKTLALAGEAQAVLSGDDWQTALARMYGDKPTRWRDDLSGSKRLRVIINGLTRIRVCDAKGHMDLRSKGAPSGKNGMIPWFDAPGRATANQATIVFGHWSTLGLMVRRDAIALDTGCVWGGQLTAMRLHDRKLVQISCPEHQKPGLLKKDQ